MAKQKFTHFVPRDQHKKRPGCHKKNQNKSECRQKKQTLDRNAFGRPLLAAALMRSETKREEIKWKNVDTVILPI